MEPHRSPFFQKVNDQLLCKQLTLQLQTTETLEHPSICVLIRVHYAAGRFTQPAAGSGRLTVPELPVLPLNPLPETSSPPSIQLPTMGANTAEAALSVRPQTAQSAHICCCRSYQEEEMSCFFCWRQIPTSRLHVNVSEIRI